MRRVVARPLAILLGLALTVAACASPAATPAPSGSVGALKVVTTTTVLADLVRNVGGPDVTVESLVPKGGEPHTFGPAPSDLRRVAEAQLLVANGLGLDDWLTDLARDSGTRAAIVQLAVGLPGATYADGDGSSANPHLWLNVAYAAEYVTRIASALRAADPAHAAGYDARATAFHARLANLDRSVRERFDAIPAANRRVVSFHDAFPYFAAAYGLEIVGVVVKAPGQDPSAGELADLITAIRTTGVRVILSEVQFSDKVVRQIAAETGANVVSDLYTDSLGDPPVDTYEALIRWDADRILDALR